MKNIVCLGAGLVAKPYIHYLSEHGFHVTVASRTVKKAEELTKGCRNTDAVKFDIQSDEKLLEKLTEESDLVCSLLPYTYHVKAAKVAIKHRKHFCTTSYISKEMSDLDSKARESDIMILNECGVDPGIDHMSAMRIIDEIHRTGGKVLSFTSFTGGLPAPDANNNPFGYKLSWSPRGVLLAGRNDAHFLQDGGERVIPGAVLFDNYEILEVPGGGKFEAYPNRDSISYIEIYRIPEVRTMLRGTLRNLGWCSTMKKITELGLLNLDESDLTGMTYADLLRQVAPSGAPDLVHSVAEAIGVAANSQLMQKLKWLGLFSEQRIPEGARTHLDALCHLFEEKMQYAPGERDMLVMHHEFIAEYSDRKEKTTSTLVDYGMPNGDSSMSRTVSLPVAIASRLILEGRIGLTGVHRPTVPEIYNPILTELKSFHIAMNEKTTRL